MSLEKEIEDVLASDVLQEIERNIALRTNCSIDESPILFDLSKKEILDADITLEKIKNFIIINPKLVTDFGVKLLLSDNNNPQAIGRGASITYSIYLIYIFEMPGKLLDYINRRRIPKAKKTARRLIAIKTEITA